MRAAVFEYAGTATRWGRYALARVRFWHLVAILAVVLVALAASRDFLTFGPETDFLSIRADAERVLSGRLPEVRWHPPLYPLVLALAYVMASDWVVAGFAIAIVSGLVVAAASYVAFSSMAGRAEGLGAAITLICSSALLTQAVSASTDAFFVALMYAAVAAAMVASRAEKASTWILCGLLIGLAYLSRANGLSLIAMMAAPLFLASRRRIASTGYTVFGFLAPTLTWVVVAYANDTPFMPAGNHLNLAATYFSSDTSGDDLAAMDAQFDGMLDVLLYDPVYLFATYSKDLYFVAQEVLTGTDILSFPMGLLVLPGLLLLVLRGSRPLFVFVILIVIPQVLLVNFKHYLPRYYLFLVPLFGAAAVTCCRYLLSNVREKRFRNLLIGALVLMLLLTIAETFRLTNNNIRENDRELRSVVRAVRGDALAAACGAVFARKPHLAYYMRCPYVVVDEFEGWDELADQMKARVDMGAVFLYIGSYERSRRPLLAERLTTGARPVWIRPYASGGAGEYAWDLYLFDVDALRSPQNATPEP